MELATLCLLILLVSGVAARPHIFLNSNKHARSPSSNFSLLDIYRGHNFLSLWDFFPYPDPTHGLVEYLSKDDALKKGLVQVKDNMFSISVDSSSDTTVGSNRASVRIQSQKTYDHGLFIADFDKMPFGCGVWPAYWSVGPDWPTGGEIDVVEGVHHGPMNHYTLHTSTGCDLQGFDNTTALSRLVSQNCQSSGEDNRGCSFQDLDSRYYGQAFNDMGGGVFVHLWDDTGIKMWRFGRKAIPEDIEHLRPEPRLWGTPAANFPSESCDTRSHFTDQRLVLDITLCGDLGTPTYGDSGCLGTCEQAVANKTNFISATWKVNYIAVYTQQ